MKNTLKSLFFAISATILTACGGGSDSTNTPGNSPVGSNEASFSLANYQNNAQILLEAANTVIGFSNKGTIFQTTPSSFNSVNSNAVSTRELAYQVANPKKFNNNATTQQVFEESAQCDNNQGSITYTYDDINNSGTFSKGETGVVVLSECLINQSVFSGKITTVFLDENAEIIEEGPVQTLVGSVTFSQNFENFTERNAETREVLFNINGIQTLFDEGRLVRNSETGEKLSTNKVEYSSESLSLKDANFSSDVEIMAKNLELTDIVQREGDTGPDEFFVNNKMLVSVKGPELNISATVSTPVTLRLGQALTPVEGSILLKSGLGAVSITFDESLTEGYSVVLDTDGDGTFETEVPASSLPI